MSLKDRLIGAGIANKKDNGKGEIELLREDHLIYIRTEASTM